MMQKKRWIAIFLCLSLLSAWLLSLAGCAVKVQADDLMKGITPEKTSGRAANDAFKNGAADFAVRLFHVIAYYVDSKCVCTDI